MKPAKAVAAVRDLSGVSCVGYVRVSTDQQATEDKTSLTDQRNAIMARALKLGVTVAEWFVDEGYSGATVEKRPAFRSLIGSCERYPRSQTSPAFILVLNDSRFGRFDDPDEATAIRFGLKQRGWHVRFAEGDETEDTTARGVLRFIGSAQASEYRLALQRNTRRGMRGSSERGYWTRPEPFGYRRAVVFPVGCERVLEPGQRKADGERVSLTPYEPEARVVRTMFEKLATGRYSVRSLAHELRTSRRAVHVILKNPVYVGDVVNGKRCASPTEQYGKRDAHPAVITRELFAKVQARLAANRATPRSPNSDYLVSGLVMCADCGRPMTGGGLGSRRADGTRTKFYKCGASNLDRVNAPKCEGKIGTVAKHLLEDAVIATLSAEIGKPATQAKIAEAVGRYLSTSGSAVTTEIAETRKELARLEKSLDRLVSAIADGTLEQREAGPHLASIRSQIEATTQRLQRLAFRQREGGATKDERARLLGMASNFAQTITKLRGPDLRELIRPWLSSATFSKSSRVLTLAIRRVPATGVFVSAHSPAPGCT